MSSGTQPVVRRTYGKAALPAVAGPSSSPSTGTAVAPSSVAPEVPTSSSSFRALPRKAESSAMADVKYCLDGVSAAKDAKALDLASLSLLRAMLRHRSSITSAGRYGIGRDFVAALKGSICSAFSQNGSGAAGASNGKPAASKGLQHQQFQLSWVAPQSSPTTSSSPNDRQLAPSTDAILALLLALYVLSSPTTTGAALDVMTEECVSLCSLGLKTSAQAIARAAQEEADAARSVKSALISGAKRKRDDAVPAGPSRWLAGAGKAGNTALQRLISSSSSSSSSSTFAFPSPADDDEDIVVIPDSRSGSQKVKDPFAMDDDDDDHYGGGRKGGKSQSQSNSHILSRPHSELDEWGLGKLTAAILGGESSASPADGADAQPLVPAYGGLCAATMLRRCRRKAGTVTSDSSNASLMQALSLFLLHRLTCINDEDEEEAGADDSKGKSGEEPSKAGGRDSEGSGSLAQALAERMQTTRVAAMRATTTLSLLAHLLKRSSEDNDEAAMLTVIGILESLSLVAAAAAAASGEDEQEADKVQEGATAQKGAQSSRKQRLKAGSKGSEKEGPSLLDTLLSAPAALPRDQPLASSFKSLLVAEDKSTLADVLIGITHSRLLALPCSQSVPSSSADTSAKAAGSGATLDVLHACLTVLINATNCVQRGVTELLKWGESTATAEDGEANGSGDGATPPCFPSSSSSSYSASLPSLDSGRHGQTLAARGASGPRFFQAVASALDWARRHLASGTVKVCCRASSQAFDTLVLSLGLLTNCAEQSPGARRAIIGTSTTLPNKGALSLLDVVASVFSDHYYVLSASLGATSGASAAGEADTAEGATSKHANDSVVVAAYAALLLVNAMPSLGPAPQEPATSSSLTAPQALASSDGIGSAPVFRLDKAGFSTVTSVLRAVQQALDESPSAPPKRGRSDSTSQGRASKGVVASPRDRTSSRSLSSTLHDSQQHRSLDCLLLVLRAFARLQSDAGVLTAEMAYNLALAEEKLQRLPDAIATAEAAAMTAAAGEADRRGSFTSSPLRMTSGSPASNGALDGRQSAASRRRGSSKLGMGGVGPMGSQDADGARDRGGSSDDNNDDDDDDDDFFVGEKKSTATSSKSGVGKVFGLGLGLGGGGLNGCGPGSLLPFPRPPKALSSSQRSLSSSLLSDASSGASRSANSGHSSANTSFSSVRTADMHANDEAADGRIPSRPPLAPRTSAASPTAARGRSPSTLAAFLARRSTSSSSAGTGSSPASAGAGTTGTRAILPGLGAARSAAAAAVAAAAASNSSNLRQRASMGSQESQASQGPGFDVGEL